MLIPIIPLPEKFQDECSLNISKVRAKSTYTLANAINVIYFLLDRGPMTTSSTAQE